MILRLLLYIQIIFIIFIKILKIIIKPETWNIVSDDMITDMLNNKRLNPVVAKLFIKGRELNIFLVFITQSYFAVPKNFRLNSTHYFIMKIINKKELQQIAFNHSSDIDFQDFMNLYKKLLQNNTLFYLLIKLLLWIILYISVRIF